MISAIIKLHMGKDLLKGKRIISGSAEGIVKVVLCEKDAKEFKEGEIFVGFALEPYAISALAKAAGVVLDVLETKQSSIHPAIVASELAIPCIAKTRAATKLLKTGDRVMVNADSGLVSLLSRSA